MLPCYIYEGQTAVARFTFTVRNDYKLAREFQFATSQQFDVELIAQTDGVVAAWSDDKSFFQMMTSFTLGPGESVAWRSVPQLDASTRRRAGVVPLALHGATAVEVVRGQGQRRRLRPLGGGRCVIVGDLEQRSCREHGQKCDAGREELGAMVAVMLVLDAPSRPDCIRSSIHCVKRPCRAGGCSGPPTAFFLGNSFRSQ